MEGGYQVVYYSNSVNKTLLPIMDRAEVLNDPTDLTTEGYLVNYGTSFVMALEFTDSGPRAKGLLTYSQSSDPRSEHFADQTRKFAQKQWRDIRFTEEDIAADPSFKSYDLFYWGPTE